MAPGRQQRQPARQSFATNMKLHSVRTGSKSILFTFSGDDRTKAYKWSKYGCLTQNKEIQKYACTSCRSIYDSNRKEGILNRPLAWIKFNVANNCFETDEPENRHVCDGPIEMNTVRGTEAARAELAKVKETRDKPKSVAIQLSAALTRRYGNRPEEDRLAIAAAVPAPANFARAASRVAASVHPRISTIDELNDIEDQNFLLTLAGEIRSDPNEK
uniref:Uncharacterized protein n=1 Tax=Panagrolaimus davidi TaxID=227884 RepID=A0A914P2E9_9BILA